MQSLSMMYSSSSPDSFAALMWEDPSALSRSPSPDEPSSEVDNQDDDPPSLQSQSQGRKRMLLHSLDDDDDGEEEEGNEEVLEFAFSFQGEEWGDAGEEEEEVVEDEEAFSQMATAIRGGLDDMDDEEEEEEEEGDPTREGGEEVEMDDLEEEDDDWDFSMPSHPSSSPPQRSPSLPLISRSPSLANLASSMDAIPPPLTSSAAERARRGSLAKSHIQRNILLPFLSQLSHSLTLVPRPGSSSSLPAPPPESDADDEDEDEDEKEKKRKKDGKIRLNVMGHGSREGLVWPNGRKTATKELARVWKVLSMMHEALMDEVVVTKRDIYYKDPKLFGSQGVVDRIVETTASSAGLRRSDFNVRASPKGLWSSKLVEIVLVDSNIDAPESSQMVEEDKHHQQEVLRCGDLLPTLIPPSETIEGVRLIDEEKELLWILIIEKDAIFQTLCSIKFGADKGLMITGKGYPDQSTSQFVALLASKFPSTKILALVDGDPDGLEILSVYKFGSRTAAKLNSEVLGVERIEWLGVKGSEWSSLNINYDLLIPLSVRDQKKIHKMLLRPSEEMPAEWRQELSHMIHLRHKAEIQLLTSSTSNSQSTLPSNSDSNPTDADSSQSQRATQARSRGGMFDDFEEVEMGVVVGEGEEEEEDVMVVRSGAREDSKEGVVGGRTGRGGAGRLMEYLEERIGRALARVGPEIAAKQEEEEEEDGMIDWFG